MSSRNGMGDRPKARLHDIVVRDLDGEALVYKLDTDECVCLEGVAAAIWRRCDGTHTIAELATDVVGASASDAEDVVRITLEQLRRHGLLDEDTLADPRGFRGMSRRQMIKVAGIASITVPLVSTLVVPAAAAAASATGTGSGGGSGSGAGSPTSTSAPATSSTTPAASSSTSTTAAPTTTAAGGATPTTTSTSTTTSTTQPPTTTSTSSTTTTTTTTSSTTTTTTTPCIGNNQPCSGPADDSCCGGATCTNIELGPTGFVCVGCVPLGQSCSPAGTSCCPGAVCFEIETGFFACAPAPS